MRRMLRVMREAGLLSPARQPDPAVERPHVGTIVTARPNMMWGTDATAAVTLVEGAATIFAAIDHCTAESSGSTPPGASLTSKPSSPSARASATTSAVSLPPPRPSWGCATITELSISAPTSRPRAASWA
jgi:hypothetical protein